MTKRHTQNILLLTFFWIFFLISISGVVFLIYVKRVQISYIVLKGDIQLSADDLSNYMGITLPLLYEEVDTETISSRLELHPLIYTAEVTKTFRGGLILFLERSIPLISILSELDGIQIPSYFNKDGQCVQVGVLGGVVDVPIVSGVVLMNPYVGATLPEWMLPLLKNIDIIKTFNNNLFKQVSEIQVKNEGNQYQVLAVYFSKYDPYFITEFNLDIERLEQLWHLADRVSMLDEMQDFVAFDVRQGIIIGKKREYEAKN